MLKGTCCGSFLISGTCYLAVYRYPTKTSLVIIQPKGWRQCCLFLHVVKGHHPYPLQVSGTVPYLTHTGTVPVSVYGCDKVNREVFDRKERSSAERGCIISPPLSYRASVAAGLHQWAHQGGSDRLLGPQGPHQWLHQGPRRTHRSCVSRFYILQGTVRILVYILMDLYFSYLFISKITSCYLPGLEWKTAFRGINWNIYPGLLIGIISIWIRVLYFAYNIRMRT